jgi:hypothetical protein
MHIPQNALIKLPLLYSKPYFRKLLNLKECNSLQLKILTFNHKIFINSVLLIQKLTRMLNLFNQNRTGKYAILIFVTPDMMCLTIAGIGILAAAWFLLIFSPGMLSKILTRTSEETFLSNQEITKYSIIFFAPHIISQVTLIFFTSGAVMHLMMAITIQILIVIPTFSALAKIGQWQPMIKSLYVDLFAEIPEESVNGYGTPYMFWSASFGILYPMIFISYLFTLRYLALGKIIDLSPIFYNFIQIMPTFALLASAYSLWIEIFFFIVTLRKMIWGNWISTLEAMNYYFIQNKIYFAIMRTIHKIVFIYLEFIFYHQEHIAKNTKFPTYHPAMTVSQVILYLRKRYLQLYVLLFLAISLEIIFTQKIQIGLYLLFFFTVVRTIIFILQNHTFVVHWPDSISRSDYLVRNHMNPYLPKDFWELVASETTVMPLGFYWDITDAHNVKLLMLRYEQVQMLQRPFEIMDKNKTRYFKRYERRIERLCYDSFWRAKASRYHIMHNLRYNYVQKRHVHTESAQIAVNVGKMAATAATAPKVSPGLGSVLGSQLKTHGTTPKPSMPNKSPAYPVEKKTSIELLLERKHVYHAATGYFQTHHIGQVYLLKDDWRHHYQTACNANAKFSTYELNGFRVPVEQYNRGSMYCNSFPQYQDVLNLLDLQSLLNHPNIRDVTGYDEKYAALIQLLRQAAPDYLIHLKKAVQPRLVECNPKIKIPNQWKHNPNGNIISMDKKNYTHYGASPNLVVITDKKGYLQILKNFFHFYKNHVGIQENWDSFLRQMKEASGPEASHIIWADFAPFFGPFHPPLWLEENFNTNHLNNEGLLLLEQQRLIAAHASDMLDSAGIPNSSQYTQEIADLRVSPNFLDFLHEIGILK